MRHLAIQIKAHRALIAAVLGLQALTGMAPYALLVAHLPMFHSVPVYMSPIANVEAIPSLVYVFFWMWFAGIGLIGAGGYWSTEVAERFSLGALRYRSLAHWLRVRLAFVVLLSVVVYGLVPLPFLLAIHPGQAASVAWACAFLALYGTHLALLLIGAAMLGVRSAHAFIAVFLYHAANLSFNLAGLPNVIHYFLIGEEAGPLTFAVATAGAALLLALMLRTFKPATLTTRGSEYL